MFEEALGQYTEEEKIDIIYNYFGKDVEFKLGCIETMKERREKAGAQVQEQVQVQVQEQEQVKDDGKVHLENKISGGDRSFQKNVWCESVNGMYLCMPANLIVSNVLKGAMGASIIVERQDRDLSSVVLQPAIFRILKRILRGEGLDNFINLSLMTLCVKSGFFTVLYGATATEVVDVNVTARPRSRVGAMVQGQEQEQGNSKIKGKRNLSGSKVKELCDKDKDNSSVSGAKDSEENVIESENKESSGRFDDMF